MFLRCGLIAVAALLCAGAVTAKDGRLPPAEADRRARELVAQMTLDEKLSMIHGQGFNIAPIPRLGIPPINMSDASMGLRITPWPACKGLEPSTAFPASILLAATWDPEMAGQYARAVAEEFRARNIHILLGPGINIYRSPLCGRNYEYMGEDPFLISRMAVAYVKAVQEVGVIPTVKHFVANNSEPRRKQSSSVVSERALREIYFPGFRAAVQEGDALGIMSAYNLLNGVYCGENPWLLKDVLRKEWGFRGMVVSDWDSLWHSELAVNSGVDIEMPGAEQTFVLAPEKVKKLLAEGKTTIEEIDSKVLHLVRPCLEMGMYSTNWARPELNRREAHARTALETAREGMVLLRNEDGLLPLDPKRVKRIVVIGPTARKTPTTGGGSGGVWPEHPVSLWDGIRKIYGKKAELLDAFDMEKIRGADAVVVCVGYNTGLKVDSPDKWKKKKNATIAEEQAAFNEGGKPMYELDNSEHEGADRPRFGLPKGDEELIARCAAANPRTVVLYTAGGGIAMPWKDKVKSILWLGYPGQNGCIAAAEILAGKVNPSGRLPFTIEKRLEDNAAFGHFGLSWNEKENGPAKSTGKRKYWDVPYTEGIFIGYRHMDKEGIEPNFCFGHGLSYTRFVFRDLKVRKEKGKVKVSLVVTNTGDRDGAEVVQLYVSDRKSSVPRPVKELKGFVRVPLKAGESRQVTMELDRSAFAFWNPKTKQWTVEPGWFDILVGASSQDIRLRAPIKL